MHVTNVDYALNARARDERQDADEHLVSLLRTIRWRVPDLTELDRATADAMAAIGRLRERIVSEGPAKKGEGN